MPLREVRQGERQGAELSEVVFEQQRALDALRAQLRMMNARIEQQGRRAGERTAASRLAEARSCVGGASSCQGRSSTSNS